MFQKMHDIQSIQKKVEYLKGQRDHLQQQLNTIQQSLSQSQEYLGNLEKALEIAKQVGLLTQKQLEYHLSEQVSMALEAVFENPYQLKVNFLEKRDKTEVEFLFCRRGMEFPAIGNVGGGVIDITSLALRIAYLSMRQDKKVRPLLILDEPFSQLKGEMANLHALAVLQEISKNLNIQVIMISDERISREDILANADKVFLVSQNTQGITNVQEEKA